ncbi:major capsid protein [Moraxella caprae]|nr:major capsid protein [Moraxella caprae]
MPRLSHAIWAKGYDIEAQSNPLSICTQPDALIELTA